MDNQVVLKKCPPPVSSIYMELPQMDELERTITFGKMEDGAFISIQSENNNVFFAGISKGSSVINRIIGVNYEEMMELLIRAVNNRTRQRNFFRLYNNMLEGIITEEVFYKTIEENEDDYVVEEIEVPTKERLGHALYISKSIKNVDNSEDLSTLFSFSSEVTDSELKMIETNGCI